MLMNVRDIPVNSCHPAITHAVLRRFESEGAMPPTNAAVFYQRRRARKSGTQAPVFIPIEEIVPHLSYDETRRHEKRCRQEDDTNLFDLFLRAMRIERMLRAQHAMRVEAYLPRPDTSPHQIEDSIE